MKALIIIAAIGAALAGVVWIYKKMEASQNDDNPNPTGIGDDEEDSDNHIYY